jgi:tyrosyl-tRNA synthetase
VTAPEARGATSSESDLPPLLAELTWRGLLNDHTPGLPRRLAAGPPISGYNGFDPSGPSLHVGHLIPVFGLLHLQRHGGRPYALVGGATGMIGDPSGRSSERNLLDLDTLAGNQAAVRAQLERYLDFSGRTGAVMVNNIDWLGSVGMLDFLRDVGKHFTIPYMLAKDSVQLRLATGLSYTEFSYMLLQAADFLHLYRRHGVELQMGGADQWGNITAGLELIRRVEGAGAGEELAHGISYPLLTGPKGEKFGKTENASIWLDAAMTTPYEFYQFWVNSSDDEVGRHLRLFTTMDQASIEGLEAEQAERPERRAAQRALAVDITGRTHGPAIAGRVVALSEAIFGGRLAALDPDMLAFAVDQLPHAELRRDEVGAGMAADRFAMASGATSSLGQARRLIAQGGFYVDDVRVADGQTLIPPPAGDRPIVVRTGKRDYRLVRIVGGSA